VGAHGGWYRALWGAVWAMLAGSSLARRRRWVPV
jgi:hypothetical protein